MDRIDEARLYLSDIFKPEYSQYINTKLAGDFAVDLAEKMKTKQCLLYIDPELSCQALRVRKAELEGAE